MPRDSYLGLAHFGPAHFGLVTRNARAMLETSLNSRLPLRVLIPRPATEPYARVIAEHRDRNASQGLAR